VLGGRKAVDLPNGRQQGHGTEEADPGDLDQEGDLLRQGLDPAQPSQFVLDLREQSGERGQQREVLADPELLGGVEGEGLPPDPLVRGER
jgi:hypothetical protein